MSSFKEKWRNRIPNSLKDDKEYITKSKDNSLLQQHVRHRLAQININLGLNSYLIQNVEDLKLRMSFVGMLNEYCFLTHNLNWPYWNMKPYSYTILSDNVELINRYSHLPVDEHLIYDDPKKGVPKGFNYAFQGLLREEDTLIEKGKTMFEQDIDKRKAIGFHKAHLACTEALASGDEKSIILALNLFEKSSVKNEAIKADLCEEIISFFPIVYAKIAWIKGIKVVPESKYMPIELLEINPLEEYTIPYWFLRDFYREQGVDWRYDPIHPELQDWENDPENPNRKKGGFWKKIF